MPRRTNEKGLVPVQAYIPIAVYRRFTKKYPSRGAISTLIRRAFEIAVEEDEQTEKAAEYAVEQYLGDD